MNICVIGYGMMGVWHSEALAGEARYFLVGRRPGRTAEFAARYGYRRWSVDLEEALADPAVDAVIVASPSELHAATALQCLAHGKPTLVEIPIAMSYAASERVVAEAERRGLTLGVVHPMRFRKERAPLRERLASGALCTRDFVAALEQGRQPAVPGRAVLPTMRLLQDVQDRWDAVHGRRSLPGRPLDEDQGQEET